MFIAKQIPLHDSVIYTLFKFLVISLLNQCCSLSFPKCLNFTYLWFLVCGGISLFSIHVLPDGFPNILQCLGDLAHIKRQVIPELPAVMKFAASATQDIGHMRYKPYAYWNLLGQSLTFWYLVSFFIKS